MGPPPAGAAAPGRRLRLPRSSPGACRGALAWRAGRKASSRAARGRAARGAVRPAPTVARRMSRATGRLPTHDRGTTSAPPPERRSRFPPERRSRTERARPRGAAPRTATDRPAVGEKQKRVRFDAAAVAGPAPMDWVAPCCVTAQFTTTAEPAIPPFEVEIAVARWTTTDSWQGLLEVVGRADGRLGRGLSDPGAVDRRRVARGEGERRGSRPLGRRRVRRGLLGDVGQLGGVLDARSAVAVRRPGRRPGRHGRAHRPRPMRRRRHRSPSNAPSLSGRPSRRRQRSARRARAGPPTARASRRRRSPPARKPAPRPRCRRRRRARTHRAGPIG